MGRQGLGEFELLVLLAVARLGEDEAYAVSIADEIATRTGRAARRAAVYTTLQRLEGRGLVTSWLGASRAERGGKARRHVRLEPPGLQAVLEARAALQNMWLDLDSLLEDS